MGKKKKMYNFYQVSIWYPAKSGCEDAYERDVLVVAKSKKSAVKKAMKYLETIEDCCIEDTAPHHIEAEKLHGIPMQCENTEESLWQMEVKKN